VNAAPCFGSLHLARCLHDVAFVRALVHSWPVRARMSVAPAAAAAFLRRSDFVESLTVPAESDRTATATLTRPLSAVATP
jgi:hypothetical protein